MTLLSVALVAVTTIAMTTDSSTQMANDEQFATIERTKLADMAPVARRDNFPVRRMRLPAALIPGPPGSLQRVTIQLQVDEDAQLGGAFGIAVEPAGADRLFEGARTVRLSPDSFLADMTVPGASSSSAYCSGTCPMNVTVRYVATYRAGSTLTLDLLWSGVLSGRASEETFTGYVRILTDARNVRRL